jgi:hypothetical protein
MGEDGEVKFQEAFPPDDGLRKPGINPDAQVVTQLG